MSTPEPLPLPPAADAWIVEMLRSFFPPGYVQSIIRTWVPIGVGLVLSWVALHWHVVVSPDASALVGAITVGVVTAVYYAAARLVERHWPRLGRILTSLGLVKARPVYVTPPVLPDTVVGV